jgi:hypothetical protein
MARLEPGKFCPLIKKDCIGLQCSWYTQVRGTDPQSGAEVDEYACAIAWLPMLMINTAKETREGAAATESLRNNLVETMEASQNVQVAIASLVLNKTLAIGGSTEHGTHTDSKSPD